MAAKRSLLLSLGLCALNTLAHVSDGRPGHGLIGITMEMYQPGCAFACRDVLSGSALACTPMDMDDMGDDMDMAMMHGDTEPECYATDDSFLQSLAYCMYQNCQAISNDTLEDFWQKNVAGRNRVQPFPKETYLQALAKASNPAPTMTLVSGEDLNATMLVNPDDYQANFNGDQGFERNEDVSATYSIVVFLCAVVTPILFSLLRFIPWPATLVTKFNAYVIDPPAWGSKHKAAVAGLYHVPTRGQALFIFYLFALNIILCAVDYVAYQPNNAWYADTRSEIMPYIANRTGYLALANLPVLILFAGRNNILLWLTNWSHQTFLLVHRYVAWICTLQAVIHSILYLRIYIEMDMHYEESHLPYWIWGSAATVAMSIMIPTAISPIRRKVYELFLVWHIALAVIVVVGFYEHIFTRFGHQWGYETWTYVAMGIWGLDRIVRVVRLGLNGVKHATITPIDSDYVRVDIPGVKGNGHAYLYFPTLTWRMWENHPFSVASTEFGAARKNSTEKQAIHLDEEKGHASSQNGDSDADSSEHNVINHEKGMTFLLRVRGGLTRTLASRTSIPVLVESAYGRHEHIPSSSNLVAIVGGVGITAILPYLKHATHSKLYWGTRTPGLIEALQHELRGVEQETFVGKRMDVTAIVEAEVEKAKAEGDREVVVIVSGPEGMADEVRLAVSRIGRTVKGAKLRLIEEAFSW